MKKKTLGNIAIIILGVLLILVSPFISFCLGWFVGLLIKIIFGTTFIKGLGLIGIMITKDQIPLLCGVIGTIASFFKNPAISNKESN